MGFSNKQVLKLFDAVLFINFLSTLEVGMHLIVWIESAVHGVTFSQYIIERSGLSQ